MYTKLFKSIVDGSLYGRRQALPVFLVMLALADKHGIVDVLPKKIADILGESEEYVAIGIKELSDPDPISRTPTEEGRRILPLNEHRSWGWKITNYEVYRNMRDEEERRIYQRQWDRENRKKPAKKNPTTNPTQSDKSDHVRPNPTNAEAEADAEKNQDMSTSSTVLGLFEHWKTAFKHPKASLDAKRKKAIAAALKAYGEEDLRNSMSGYLNSPHHMGKNSTNTVYDEITLLLRDSAHIDAGLQFYAAPPKPPEPRAPMFNGQVLMTPEQVEVRKLEKAVGRREGMGQGFGFSMKDFRLPNPGETGNEYLKAQDDEFKRRCDVVAKLRRKPTQTGGDPA